MNVADMQPAEGADEWDQKFQDDLAADVAFESGLFLKELCIVAIILALVLLRELYL